MYIRTTTALIAVVFFSAGLYAQNSSIDQRWLHGFWTAKWIAHPTAPANDFGVYHFRKSFVLDVVPSSFIVHVSADNRYRLFINGRSVATGPARSDLANWNFETIDLGPYLVKGKNCIAATVWNFAEYRPYSQVSFQTAFILQGDAPPEALVNTDASWKVIADSAYMPLPIDREKLQTYIVTASGEKVDGNKYAWGFEQTGYDDSPWPQATALWYPAKSRSFGTDGNWMLVPRSIPLPEETPQRFAAIRRSDLSGGGPQQYTAFTRGSGTLSVPAHSHATILFDQSFLTNAYPVLTVSGGQNSVIRLSYAEALVDDKREKGNRDSIGGKHLVGISDEFISDGARKQVYSPLFFRTFRYLELRVETGNSALQIDDFHSIFTGYPFKERAYFRSDRSSLEKIWTTGWRTARLCAVDTYFDCPYYEQLQYVGDTRIQSMISLYLPGDDRLMKKAIDDISHSLISDGLTQSRYPSRDMQVIPTFSLWWVCMVHDYWMHRRDDAFIRSHLNAMADVLQWYRERIAENGMLGSLSWWQFVDWSWPWVDSIRVGGVPPGASRGGSSIITLQYAYTLQRAAAVMRAFGRKELGDEYATLAQSLTATTYRLCWDQNKGLLADTYEKKEFSQHANIMAVLTDAIPAAGQQQVMEKILSDKQITQCTYYFKFYLFEALKKTGLGNRFLDLLQPWYDMLDIGLTTFAENPEPTRSDCHAWSASPDYELLSLVCGIRPETPGFEKVLIEPCPGNLKWIEGSVPHPLGDIRLQWRLSGNKAEATVTLPEGLSGDFVWKGKTIPLKAGVQRLDL